MRKQITPIADYRESRFHARLSQHEYWGRVGVTQTAGSRYENGAHIPLPIVVLAHLIYVQKLDVDARDFIETEPTQGE